MKMSKENYEVFMGFVNETIENATDDDMELLLAGIMQIAMYGSRYAKKKTVERRKLN